MLGSPCSPCCAGLACLCGEVGLSYEQQTGPWSAGARWCCSNTKPAEITVRYSSSGSLVGQGFRTVIAGYGSVLQGWYYDGTRGWHKRRFLQTLAVDSDSVNVDHVLVSTLFDTAYGSSVRMCGYSPGWAEFPKVYAGGRDVRYPNGFLKAAGGTWTPYEDEPWPSYTITFESANTLPGTVRREWYYQSYPDPPWQSQPISGWTRDASIDTEGGPVAAMFLFYVKGHTVFNEPACDLRGRGLSWSWNATATYDSSADTAFATAPQSAGNGPTQPTFALTAALL